MIDDVLLTTAPISTFTGDRALTRATGFFYEAGGRLMLVTARHVFLDNPSGHAPDRIAVSIHDDFDDLSRAADISIPLYARGAPLWRETRDRAGLVDIAVIDIDKTALPGTARYHAFTPADIHPVADTIEIGAALLTLGYPLGFDDSLHHLPVARHATLASSYGLRFKGMGYFLVDARTHRGISGAPVVIRSAGAGEASPRWRLLGVHSARLEASTRDPAQDEVLGLNAVWYSDALSKLA